MNPDPYNLSEEEIQKFVDSFCLDCPRCGGEVERQWGGHERDSSNDWYECLKCEWKLGEMSTWRFTRSSR